MNTIQTLHIFFPRPLGRLFFTPVGSTTTSVLTTTIPDSLPTGSTISMEFLLKGNAQTNLGLTIGGLSLPLVPNFTNSAITRYRVQVAKGSRYVSVTKFTLNTMQTYAVFAGTPFAWSGNTSLELTAALTTAHQIWGASITGVA